MAVASAEPSARVLPSPAVGPAGGVRAEAAADPRDRRGPFRPEHLASARRRLSARTLATLFQGGDALAVLGVTTAMLGGEGVGALLHRPLAWIAPSLAGAVVTLAVLRLVGAYGFGQRERLSAHLGKVVLGLVLGGGAALAAAYALAPRAAPLAGLWTAMTAVLLLTGHAWAWALVRDWRQEGRLTPNVVIVGATPGAERLIEAALKSREVAILGVFDDRAARVGPDVRGVPVLGGVRSLLEHKVLPYVDAIVITVTPRAERRVAELIERLRVLPNTLHLLVESDAEAPDATLSRMAETPLRQVSGVRSDERRALVKRVVDVALAAVGLVAIAPVLAAVALAVRLDSPGPILFRQRRHGFHNETITVWKFRSMRQDATDPTSAQQVRPDDERVTRVGRLIRRTSLDELPQLWNVLRGEMSLVGPRPHAIGMLTGGEEAARLVAEYAHRHRMKPGITGWAQINGSRGPVDTPEAVRRRVALDVAYIERQSVWFDLYILVLTLPRLLGDGDTVR